MMASSIQTTFESKNDLNQCFKAAVDVIRSLPKNGTYKPSNEMMLKFYAYYKQAVEGPCKITRPAFYEVVAKAKWDAWSALGDMDKETAMEKYVEELKQIIETMSFTDKVADFIALLGPFYEEVDQDQDTPTPIHKRGVPLKDSGQLGNDRELREALTVFSHAQNGVPPGLSEASRYLTTDSSSPFDRHVNGGRHIDLPELSPVHSYDEVSEDWRKSVEESEEELIIESEPTLEDEEVKVVCLEKTKGKGDLKTSDEPCRNRAGTNGVASIASDSDSETDYCDTLEQPVHNVYVKVLSEKTVSNSSPCVNNIGNHRQSHSETDAWKNSVADEQDEIATDPRNQSLPHDRNTSSSSQDESTLSEGLPATPETSHAVGVMVTPQANVVRGGGDDSRSRQARGSMPVQGATAQDTPPTSGEVGPPGGSSVGASMFLISGGAAGAGGGQDPRGTLRTDVTEQIAATLHRLQQDMEHVLTRLSALETLTIAQHQALTQYQFNQVQAQAAAQEEKREGFWSWLFPKMHGRTVLLLIVWPFVVHWVLHVTRRRRSRIWRR